MNAQLTAQIEKVESFAAERTTAALGTAFALMATGGVLVALALRDSVPPLLALGVLLVAFGLGVVHKAMESAANSSRWAWAVGGLAILGIGVFLASNAMEKSALFVGSLGAVVAVLGALGLASVIHDILASGPKWLVAAGPVVAAIGLALVASGGGFSVGLGVLMVVVGIALFKVGLRSVCATDGGSAGIVSMAGAGCLVAGVATAGVAGAQSSVRLAEYGGALVVVGLIAVSEGWPAVGLGPVGPRTVRVVGAFVALVTALLAVRLSGLPVSAVAIATLLAALVGASFVWRGEGVVLLTLVAVSFGWLLVDRQDERPTDPRPKADGQIVAIGDSYMSGEGAPVFFAGTNTKGAHTNECRRAPTAYPYLVAERLDVGLDFLACSGAKAKELWSDPQMPNSSPDVVGGMPQLDNVEAADVDRTRAVLVSVGGNDAAFGIIGRGCVVPGSCDELGGLWQAGLDNIVPTLVTTYGKIKEKFPNAPIVVMPYPLLVRPEGCDWSPLEPSEHAFLASFITLLDERIELASSRAGVHYFEPSLYAFEGHKICDGEGPDGTVMNFINVNPVDGAFSARISPRNWIHGSLHPSPAGHELVADKLTPFLQRLLSDVQSGFPANPAPNLDVTADDLGRSGASTEIFNPARLPDTAHLECAAVDEIDPFATRVTLFGDRSVVRVDGDPTQALCYTDKSGRWVSRQSIDPQGFVPTVPAEVPTAEDHYEQYVVYHDRARGWRLRVLTFCRPDPGCPDNAGDWTNEQLATSVKYATPPAIILLIAGWLIALGGSRRVQQPA